MSVAFTNQQWWLNHTQIPRSLRFNSADSAYLSRTPSVVSNRKTWTWAGWVKRSKLSSAEAGLTLFSAGTGTSLNHHFGFSYDSFYVAAADGVGIYLYTTPVFRDTSAWYHIVVASDTSQATPSNRIKVYINGSQVTQFSSSTYPTQDYVLSINNNVTHKIGARERSSIDQFFDGYLTDIHFIDGQALEPTAFGTFDENGDWQKIPYEGTYGTNGFHLPFTDNSSAAALGTDTSGNGNTWTVNNISVAAGAGNDSLIDTPTSYGTDIGAGGEVRGNYATLNPLFGDAVAIKNGNLDYDGTVDASLTSTRATFSVSSGKWYYEVTLPSPRGFSTGWVASSDQSTVPSVRYGIFCRAFNNDYRIVVDSSFYDPGDTGAANDVIGVAFDADQEKAWFAINGVWKGATSQDPSTDTGGYSGSTMVGPYIPYVTRDSRTHNPEGSVNFGQRPFAYPAPSGFKALCTTNLPDPVVAQPSTVMDVKLYTGNGSTQNIAGLGFSPDFVWIKARSQPYSNTVFDAIRGATNYLYTDTTGAEATNAQFLTAFNSDGFSLGTNAAVNQSSTTYAAWTWDAGSSTVTNTQGSITSQVRANPSAGFSIVSYKGNGTAGATVGHGLGVAPSFVIQKDRDTTTNWQIYHIGAQSSGALQLKFTTDAATSNTTVWNNTAPSSSVITLGNGGTNTLNNDQIIYAFAPVDGYSSFGSYTGNGSADGPFVYTGFRPRWLLIKLSSASGQSWLIHDTERDTYNVSNKLLFPNLSNAEATVSGSAGYDIDILSNGFKIRNNNNAWNASGGTYIYATFAESPFQTSRAR